MIWCQNCGAKVSSCSQASSCIKIASAAPVAVAEATKAQRLVTLLWLAARPGGASQAEAFEIVDQRVNARPSSLSRTVRRYVAELRLLGFDIEVKEVERLVCRVIARNVRFQIAEAS